MRASRAETKSALHLSGRMRGPVAIFPRTCAKMLPEATCEIRHVLETDGLGDLGYAQRGLREQLARLFHAARRDQLNERLAGFLLQQMRWASTSWLTSGPPTTTTTSGAIRFSSATALVVSSAFQM